MRALDLFSGGGGVGVGLTTLGYQVTAIDNVADCLATCHAAGHETKRWDLTQPYLPKRWFDLIWASPPCTGFSVAGKRKALSHVGELMKAVVNEDWDWGRHNKLDPEVWLILPTMETFLHVRPTAIAMENVQQTRPVMEACLRVLKRYGYRGEVGVLSAEQFGVPQTRLRCFLVAQLRRDVSLPAPTHQEYINPRHHLRAEEVARRDRHLKPWMSMAQALGDDFVLNTGRDWKLDGGRDDAQVIQPDHPAPTVSAQSGRQWVWLRTNGMDNDASRHVGEPAPTLNFGHNASAWCFESDATSVRVAPQQLARLQAFNDDHPWRGSKTSIHRKIGNAVPPPVAMAVVGGAAGIGWEPVCARYLDVLYRPAG